MTYYNQYEEMEWGARPHQGNLMDVLWERSALKHVAAVKTPTMLVHGENDNDVPIAESEQFYVALRDVGVEAVLVRYPREGHGLREGKHLVDLMDRSVAWYEKHFGVDIPLRAALTPPGRRSARPFGSVRAERLRTPKVLSQATPSGPSSLRSYLRCRAL